jgi:hypothetical protein
MNTDYHPMGFNIHIDYPPKRKHIEAKNISEGEGQIKLRDSHVPEYETRTQCELPIEPDSC